MGFSVLELTKSIGRKITLEVAFETVKGGFIGFNRFS